MPRSDDLELTSGLDQPVPFDVTPALEEIDKVIHAAKQEQSLEPIFNKARELVATFRASGLSLAKLLYKTQKVWFEFTTDNFYDAMFDVVGLQTVSIERYIRVWKMHEEGDVPPELEPYISTRPMKDQIPIASALEQGYTISDEQWQELAQAPDNTSIGSILREIKGQEPRKSALLLTLKRNGDIVAFQDGQTAFVGWLSIEAPEELTQKAISRIMDRASIMKE